MKYFEKLLQKRFGNQKLDIYVDMDGVIVDYTITDANSICYLDCRPLKTNLKLFARLNENENITLHILSICRNDKQIKEKNAWLDKNAPFFKQRNIISKESNPNKDSKTLKRDFLEALPKSDSTIVFIDDDNDILKEVTNSVKNITAFQDSSLID